MTSEEPKDVIEYEDNEDFDGKVMTRVTYSCPTCNAKVIPWQKHCHRCEQLLRWII